MIENLTIVTGQTQSGKTTWLKDLVSQTGAAAGILMPVIDGRRFFYDIETKEAWPAEAMPDESTLNVGRFQFSRAAFTKASEHLCKAIQSGNGTIIIDEIGPLELVQHSGFFEVLKECLTSAKPIDRLIIAVRKSMLGDAIAFVCRHATHIKVVSVPVTKN